MTVAPPPRGGRAGPQAVRPCFAHRFLSGDRATRQVLAALVADLAAAGIGGADLSTIELILAEALNNVAEHAYRDGPGIVELCVEVSPSGLMCRIADRGQPMPAGTAPDPPLPVIDPPQSLPEGGFGWHIIRCLTRDLSYRRDCGRNELTMLVPLGASP